jgi:hypothetical protein
MPLTLVYTAPLDYQRSHLRCAEAVLTSVTPCCCSPGRSAAPPTGRAAQGMVRGTRIWTQNFKFGADARGAGSPGQCLPRWLHSARLRERRHAWGRTAGLGGSGDGRVPDLVEEDVRGLSLQCPGDVLCVCARARACMQTCISAAVHGASTESLHRNLTTAQQALTPSSPYDPTPRQSISHAVPPQRESPPAALGAVRAHHWSLWSRTNLHAHR